MVAAVEAIRKEGDINREEHQNKAAD